MISIIVAMDRSGLIGKGGKMPWSIKSEMKHFQEITTGGACIFGRKTWESLPEKPLPRRINMVVSSTLHEQCGNIICSNLDGAITTSRQFWPSVEIFICGGSSLYKEALPFADRIYLSCIWGDYNGDTFFPCKPSNLLYDMDFTITKEFGTVADGEAEAWDFYLLERHVRTF